MKIEFKNKTSIVEDACLKIGIDQYDFAGVDAITVDGQAVGVLAWSEPWCATLYDLNGRSIELQPGEQSQVEKQALKLVGQFF